MPFNGGILYQPSVQVTLRGCQQALRVMRTVGRRLRPHVRATLDATLDAIVPREIDSTAPTLRAIRRSGRRNEEEGVDPQ